MTISGRAVLGLRHLTLVVLSFLMLVPFYWVLKTSITDENIFAYPPHILPTDPNLFSYVDVWYLIPFPRFLWNSVVVSLLAIVGNLVLNALAGYALTRVFLMAQKEFIRGLTSGAAKG